MTHHNELIYVKLINCLNCDSTKIHARGMCKSCYGRDHYNKKRETVLRKQKEYYEKNPEKYQERLNKQKECASFTEYQKNYYQQNKEKKDAQNKEWTCNNKERAAYHRRKWALKKKYGITMEEYNQLFEFQNGCCAVCNRSEEELGRRLHIDHDHITGKICGLLCDHCNQAAGLLKEDLETVEKLVKYLKEHNKVSRKLTRSMTHRGETF